MFYSSWYRKGVTKIHHLLNERGNFLSRPDFQRKYGLSVNFLTYNSKNVTAKTAHKMFVLKMLKPLNVERNLVEQNLSNYLSRSQWKTNLDVSNIRWYITFYLLTTIFTK